MDEFLDAIVLIWIICFVGIGTYFVFSPLGETETEKNYLTEQQYKEQSLQYLEDIRNSNDKIYSVLVQ